MFTLRYMLGWGLMLLVVTPSFAQTRGRSESPPRPFHEVSISSFNDIWKEQAAHGELPKEGGDEDSIEQAVAQFWDAAEVTAGGTSERDSALPRLTLTPITPSTARQAHFPPSLEADGTDESGLFRWLLGMLGVVGIFALGGVYWIYQFRPSLHNHQATDRLQLSSALSLPRRAGLFLVDVGDQPVLVAMDGGGIRQVVPLTQRHNAKTTERRKATNQPHLAPPTSALVENKAPDLSGFHELYQERLARNADELAVLPTIRSTRSPLTPDATADQAS